MAWDAKPVACRRVIARATPTLCSARAGFFLSRGCSTALSRTLALLTTLLPVASVCGQPASSAVDAGVADLDPQATSLRVLEPGIGQFDFATRLRTVDFGAGWGVRQEQAPRVNAPLAVWRDPATGLLHHQPRRLRAPGVRALVDRQGYLVRRGLDGAIDPNAPRIAVVGANTVFELTPERPTAAPRPAGPPPPGLLDTRLDMRVGAPDDLRSVGQRIGATVPKAAARRSVRNGPAAGAEGRVASPAAPRRAETPAAVAESPSDADPAPAADPIPAADLAPEVEPDTPAASEG